MSWIRSRSAALMTVGVLALALFVSRCAPGRCTVVFVDEAMGTPPVGRLRVTDLATAGTPTITTIVDGADATFLVAPSEHAVVYSWRSDLYAAPIP